MFAVEQRKRTPPACTENNKTKDEVVPYSPTSPVDIYHSLTNRTTAQQREGTEPRVQQQPERYLSFNHPPDLHDTA